MWQSGFVPSYRRKMLSKEVNVRAGSWCTWDPGNKSESPSCWLRSPWGSRAAPQLCSLLARGKWCKQRYLISWKARASGRQLMSSESMLNHLEKGLFLRPASLYVGFGVALGGTWVATCTTYCCASVPWVCLFPQPHWTFSSSTLSFYFSSPGFSACKCAFCLYTP